MLSLLHPPFVFTPTQTLNPACCAHLGVHPPHKKPYTLPVAPTFASICSRTSLRISPVSPLNSARKPCNQVHAYRAEFWVEDLQELRV